jgi:hypothetical protein
MSSGLSPRRMCPSPPHILSHRDDRTRLLLTSVHLALESDSNDLFLRVSRKAMDTKGGRCAYSPCRSENN